MTPDTTPCPRCGHAPSEHYGSEPGICMIELPDDGEEDAYCGCNERFNLKTGKRFPNRAELISMLECAAESLQEYCAQLSGGENNDGFAMEIKRKLKGE